MPPKEKRLKFRNFCLIIITITAIIILSSLSYILLYGGPISIKLHNELKIKLKGLSILPLSIESINISFPNYNTFITLENLKLVNGKLNIKRVTIDHLFSLAKDESQVNINENPSNPMKIDFNKILNWLHYFRIVEISVDDISILLNTPEESYLSITSIKANLTSENNKLNISGENVETKIKIKERTEKLTGTLFASLTTFKNNLELEILKCELGGNTAKGNILLDDTLSPKTIKIHEITLKNNLLNFLLLVFLGPEYYAEKVILKDVKFQIAKEQPYLFETSEGNIDISSLIYGSKDFPLICLSPHIQWKIESYETQNALKFNAIASTNGLEVKSEGLVHQNLIYEVQFQSIGNLQSIKDVSPYYFSTIPQLKIDEEKIKIHSNLKGDKNQFEGKIGVTIPSINNIELHSNFKAKLGYPILSSSKFQFQGKLTLGSNNTSYDFQIDKKTLKCKVTSQNLSLSELIQTFLFNYDTNLLKMFSTNLETSFSGDLYNINFSANGTTYTPSDEDLLPIAPAQWRIDGTLFNLSYLKGNLSFSSENSLNLNLNDFQINLFPLKISSPITFSLHLSNIDNAITKTPITGSLNMEGNIDWNINQPLKLNFNTAIEGLGYPPYFLPENIIVTFRGTLEYDPYLPKLAFPLIELGLNNYHFLSIENALIKFLENSTNPYPYFKIDSLKFNLNGENIAEYKILPSASGDISLQFSGLEYKNGDITFKKHSGKIQNFSFELPYYKLKVENINAESTNYSENTLTYSLAFDNLSLYRISLSNANFNGDLSTSPFQLLQKNCSAKLWDSKINSNVSMYKKENSFLGNFSGKITQVNLKKFTDELQPPWLKLTGTGNADFDFLFDFSKFELVDGDFSLVCNKGITINRDVLLKLIMYLQNVKVVEKRLEKLLGNEDPKKFNYAELNLAYKDRKATLALLLSTRELELAPIIYINANWKQLLSLLTMPSNFEIELK